MDSSHQRLLEDLRTSLERLDELDDIWTEALDAGRLEDAAVEAIAAATEMQNILLESRKWLPIAEELALADMAAFDSAAAEVVAAMELDDGPRAVLQSEFGVHGWSNEVHRAFRLVGGYAEVEAAEIELKSGQLRRGFAQAGDLAPWFKCSLHVAIFGLGVAGVVLGGVPVVAVAAVKIGAAGIGLGLGLASCRGDRRYPDVTAELERLARLGDAGYLTEDQYQAAMQLILTTPRQG